ncbi:MAG: hypothetical protein HY043_00920 [Verrucomicrobia bacterium]|nr:hypothetical protein [Verrucomicrobiota bacterium]
MNAQPEKSCRTFFYAVAVLGTFLLMYGMVKVVIRYTKPQDTREARATERRKNLADLRAANADALNNYAWVDQGKGIVRLPVDRALELAEQKWKNPAEARVDLIKRAEKAAAPPPEKKSEFE